MRVKQNLSLPCGLLIFSTAWTLASEDFKPGVQHICIPDANGETWQCGTMDNPPKSARIEEETEAIETPPPRFLVAPEKQGLPASPTTTEMALNPLAVVNQELPQSTAGFALPGKIDDSATDNDDSNPVKKLIPANSTTHTRTPVEITTNAITLPITLTDIPGAEAFVKLPSAYYTLQIANAASAQEFPQLISTLGLNYRDCYVLQIPGDTNDWWLLTHGAFADLNSAKAAALRLPRHAQKGSIWPRRIAYLQSEYHFRKP